MGVGYQASALHLISYLVEDEETPPMVEPPPWLKAAGIVGVRRHTAPVRFRSQSIADIEAWRDDFAARRLDQLGEALTWDETDDFSMSEDAYVSDDVMLRYLAGIVELEGEESARRLVGAERPAYREIGRVLEGFDDRLEASRFPQLLLTDQCWFPFKRNIVIGDTDWGGVPQRFGSTLRLADELRDIRKLIARFDPGAMESSQSFETPLGPLAAAWRVSETVEELCSVAIERGLPLWTTN